MPQTNKIAQPFLRILGLCFLTESWASPGIKVFHTGGMEGMGRMEGFPPQAKNLLIDTPHREKFHPVDSLHQISIPHAQPKVNPLPH